MEPRRYSGYDEYEGIFGALGSARSTTRGSWSLAATYGRSGSHHITDSVSGLHARGFPSARSTSRRRPGAGLTTNEYERRERYLRERRSKRRLKPVGGSDDDDALAETPQTQQQQQIWLPTKNFSFRQRAGKLDTRTIARLDLQKIVATTDVETIQRHLENLAFSDVTLDDVQQYSDVYFLKLFQIAQLTVEYLLNVQDSLSSHCENLETQCEGLAEECQSLEGENQKVEGEILALKKEIRQKQSTLATFEVMLLNATAAKRASQGLRAMEHHTFDQENDPAVLNILGLAAGSAAAKESGAVPLVSSCVLCGKKFISPEYLVRHQQKKHTDEAGRHRKKNKKKKRESDSSASEGSGRDSETTSTRKRREPKTAPLPAEVIQALNDRNELTKQLMELQVQLRSEKEKRADEAKHAEQQQAQLANQLASYMTKLQDTLVDMEKKQEQSKHEMMRYTQEALERAKTEQANRAKDAAKMSRAGRIESDDDDDKAQRQRKKAASPEEVEKRILDSLLRAQAEIHHKNSELEHTNRKLQTKLRRKARQLQYEPPVTTLMSMTAMDAQRFGTDLGLDIDDRMQRAKVKSVVVEDKPVQTDEEKEDPRKKTTVTQSQLVQTDIAPVETVAKPEPKPIVRQPPPPLKRAESKIPSPSMEPPKLVAKLTPSPEAKPVEEVKPPHPAPPKEPVAVPTEERKPESTLQHAASVVGKVALGFLTRRTLQNPSNWLVTLPRGSLSHALSEGELDSLTRAHDGELQDVTVEIEDHMTANDLRVAFADALSERDGDAEATNDDHAIDYHRILLHQRRTGQEVSGDQFIYHLRNQLDVEIIPCFDAAESHVGQVLDLHEEQLDQLQRIRRASMELAPGDLPLARRIRNRDDAEEIAARAATRIQSLVRCFLAVRTVEMMKIDRLVEARLVAMRSLTSTPRNRSVSSARHLRRETRSASVVAIQSETADEKIVADKAEQIHARLADLVKQKTGIDTRTKSAKWSRGQLSTEAYERHADAITQNRKILSPEVQQRIAEISERVDRLLDETYDPIVAKHEEEKYVAASRIQLAVQVAVARKKLKQLLGQKEGVESRSDSHATIEHDQQSLPSRDHGESEREDDGEDSEHKEHEEQKNDGSDQQGDDVQLDVEELDDVDIQRLADAYEQAADTKEGPAPTPLATPEPAPKPTPVEAKPKAESKPGLPPRAGTPPPSQEDLLGRSPRPKGETHVISPFSKTPLLSRRAAVTRRGSGYDNAR